MYYIVQITQSNNFYAKSFNFPYSLYYLGAPVLLSFTQFSPSGSTCFTQSYSVLPSDKYFLTFPPLSSAQFSSLVLTGWSLIGRDVCHTDLGWLIAQRTLAPLDHLWSDGLYISLYLDGRIWREEQSTYLPTLAVAYSSRIFLSPISSLTLAVAAAQNCSMRAAAWI